MQGAPLSMIPINRLQAMLNLEDSFEIEEEMASRNNAMTIEEVSYEFDLVRYCQSLCDGRNINLINAESSMKRPTKSRSVQTDSDISTVAPSWITEGQRLINLLYTGLGNTINTLYHPPLTRQEAIAGQGSTDAESSAKHFAHGNACHGSTKNDLKQAPFNDLDRQRQVLHSDMLKKNLDTLMGFATKLRDLASYLNADNKCPRDAKVRKPPTADSILQSKIDENLIECRNSLRSMQLLKESILPCVGALGTSSAKAECPTTVNAKVSDHTQTDSVIRKCVMEDKCQQTNWRPPAEIGDLQQNDRPHSTETCRLQGENAAAPSDKDACPDVVVLVPEDGKCLISEAAEGENAGFGVDAPDCVSQNGTGDELAQVPDSTVPKSRHKTDGGCRRKVRGEECKANRLYPRGESSKGKDDDRAKTGKALPKVPEANCSKPSSIHKNPSETVASSKAAAEDAKFKKSGSYCVKAAFDHARENEEQGKNETATKTQNVCKNFIKKNIMSSKQTTSRACSSNAKHEVAGSSPSSGLRPKVRLPFGNRSPCPRRVKKNADDFRF